MERRERPKAVTLTDAAAERVKSLMEQRDAGFLRVGVKNGGCAGMEYTLEYVTDVGPMDERVTDKGVEIVLESKALLFLLGSEIDYEISTLHSKFVFNNPNQTDACGCGESVTIVPVAEI